MTRKTSPAAGPEVELTTTMTTTAAQVRFFKDFRSTSVLTQCFPFLPGLGSFTDEIQTPIIPPHNPIDPGIRHVPEVTRNNIDNSQESPSEDPDLSESSRETKPASGSSSPSRDGSWRTKRLILTYFLPIVMAWFGGSIGSAVADLL